MIFYLLSALLELPRTLGFSRFIQCVYRIDELPKQRHITEVAAVRLKRESDTLDALILAETERLRMIEAEIEEMLAAILVSDCKGEDLCIGWCYLPNAPLLPDGLKEEAIELRLDQKAAALKVTPLYVYCQHGY
jgi:hypothetical protein